MAVTIWQGISEQSDDTLSPVDRAARLKWHAKGSSLTNDISAAVLASVPSTYRGLTRTKYTLNYLGGEVWEIDVMYVADPPLETDGYKVEFKTTGGKVKYEQSLETLRRYVAGGLVPLGTDTADSPDFKKLINVHGDQVDGVEITIPMMMFSITKKYDAFIAGSDMVQGFYELTGRTNADVFTINFLGQSVTFRVGAVLYNGAQIKDGGIDALGVRLIEAVHEFEAQGSRVDYSLGDINNIEKHGWEYMWAYYVREATHTLRKIPRMVSIERLFEPGDFAALRL